MAIPTIAWDESAPLGFREKKKGAERIRELKTQIREIYQNDHCTGSSGDGSYWGSHIKLTFHEQDSDQIADPNTGVLYAKEIDSKAELFWYDEQDHVIQLTSKGSFSGGMVNEVRIYSGLISNIPYGWSICDGEGSKPNLINRFVRGIHSQLSQPNVYSGGNATLSLTTANMPSHTHTVYNDYDEHTHQSKIALDSGPGDVCFFGVLDPITDTYDNFDTENTHTHTTSTFGSGMPFSNLPSYVTEIFIIKVQE